MRSGLGGCLCSLRLFLFSIGNDAELLAVGTDKVFILLCLEQYDRKDGDNCGNQKAPFEVVRITGFAKIAAYQRGKERAYVDAHIEYGIGGVQPSVARFVQLSHEGRYRRFETSVSQYKEGESAIHQPVRQLDSVQHGRAEEHQKLSQCHHDGSPEDRTADAPVFVGNISADKRGEVDQSGVAAVDGSGVFFVEQQGLCQEQNENSPHAIVAETFCGTGGENQVKSFRVFGCAHWLCVNCLYMF